MKSTELSSYCLKSLKEAGMDKSEFFLDNSKRYEMNLFGSEITLLRTTFDNDLNLAAINDGRKGFVSLNKTDEASLTEAVKSVVEISGTAETDTANDISPMQPPLNVSSGDSEPDLDKMHERLESFLKQLQEKHPKIKLLDCLLDFTKRDILYANTNGVELNASKGVYTFMLNFSAQDGLKSSSLNGSAFTTSKLDKELLEYGSIELLLKQAAEQLETETINGKFTGDIILTPDCLGDVLEAYFGVYLRDMAMIAGTSPLKDKLDQKVASDKLTVHSTPSSSELSGGYSITSDGYEAKDMTILQNGVLKTFLLSQYGANKTGKERALNPGGTYIVEPGEKSLDEIIGSIKRGLLVARFSGGNPSRSGDFSGIAKNSYYIEDGKIKYPVSETMIAGNLLSLFNSILDVSNERIDFGYSILPWIASSGVTISGK